VTADPFAVLGLPADPGLSDEQVRAAWRQIATATHPDRPDGGDPVRYAAASAAYAVLRTRWGRSEAYADLAAQPPPTVAPAGRRVTRLPGLRLRPGVALVLARIRHGRPWRLLLRVVGAVLLGLVVVRSGAGGPATAATVTGLAVWLALTVRGDLAPPPGR
jgi:hypothetical protein